MLNEQCPECGLRYYEFKQTGKLGCAECYYTFDSHLEKLVKRVHGVEEKQNYLSLKRQLDEAVKNEEYEIAAELHKKIKELGYTT